MTRYRAAWVVPVAGPPLRDAWVAVSGDRIVAVGRDHDPTTPVVDLGQVTLMPGLVNAHTHLELSHLRDQIPPASDFVTWVRGVMATRRPGAGPSADTVAAGIQAGIDEAVASGTVLVGDISNTLAPWTLLAASPLGGVLFNEIIRFNTPDPVAVVAQACQQIDALPPAAGLRASLAAHAPYSVAPLVFRAIRDEIDRRPFLPYSVHLAESRDESEFIRTGGGQWRTFLEQVGSWDPAWTAPGGTPVDYLDDAGFVSGRSLVVHGVQMTGADLARIARRGATLVTCPRSNVYTGAGRPPVEAFYAAGVPVAVGTDSLASTPDLNLFSELASMHALAPNVPAARLIESATVVGARALGFESEFGTLEPGKRARLLSVETPADVVDVEQYLVSGIAPSRLRWVTGASRS